MSGWLRAAPPPASPSFFARLFGAFAATRLGRFLWRHLFWELDPRLLRATRSRVSSTFPVFPTNVLETVGARTGHRRRKAVIYFHDGDDVVILASHAGRADHPAWYYNLRANPAVTFGGVRMTAAEVLDEGERERLWILANRVFPAFERYGQDAAKAGRTIPIIRLKPVE